MFPFLFSLLYGFSRSRCIWGRAWPWRSRERRHVFFSLVGYYYPRKNSCRFYPPSPFSVNIFLFLVLCCFSFSLSRLILACACVSCMAGFLLRHLLHLFLSPSPCVSLSFLFFSLPSSPCHVVSPVHALNVMSCHECPPHFINQLVNPRQCTH